jgi:hypothetical protein
VTPGTGTSTYDGYSERIGASFQSLDGGANQIGSGTTVERTAAAGSTTSLATSALVMSSSGANIVATLTATATSGALGTVDCEIRFVDMLDN